MRMVSQVAEECGFRVDPDKLQLISGYRSSVGTSGSHHTLFFAEVSFSPRASPLSPPPLQGLAILPLQICCLTLCIANPFPLPAILPLQLCHFSLYICSLPPAPPPLLPPPSAHDFVCGCPCVL